jgi:predicted transposase YdaD
MSKKGNKQKAQSGQYDKIIKENLELTLPVIIRELLGIEIAKSEELPDDLQHTKERKPDTLKKVTDTKGNTFVLHVEFQAKDDAEMVYREAEYYIMLKRKYRIPVKQYVIYLGEGQSTMPTELNDDTMTFRYNLISISQTPYQLFLKSSDPEVNMLGILGNFGNEDKENAIREIVNSVQSRVTGDLAKSQKLEQLRIFAQLRNNIGEEIKQVLMETITKFFKKENDFLYKEGEEKGMEIGMEKGIEIGMEEGMERGIENKSREFVLNLIQQTDFSDTKIADLAAVSTHFVRKMRTDLNKKMK